MLHIQNMSYRIGGRTLFDEANGHLPAGHHVGFVGGNGTGKTTLLRLILGQAEMDGGSIHVQAKAQVGMMAQEAPSGSRSPLEETLAADHHRTRLLDEAETATDAQRIADVHDRLVDIDAHSAPARAASILAGLGFDEDAQHRQLSTFSGGWRMRVALAAVLFSEPDLLLLDEPTNHLDLESSIWLQNFLAQYPHTFLMVSHDRNMLNNAVDHVLHLENGKIEMYTGGFDSFERVRTMRLAQNDALAAKQEVERKKMQAFVDRFRAQATKARQAQSRVKQLEKMAPIEQTVATGPKIDFHFPEPLAKPSPLIRLDQVAVGYDPDKPILEDLHLSIYADDRIALLGANGNGKTTLARALCGELEPQSGNLISSSKLTIGYFAQDQLEQLDPRLTALEQMRQLMPDSPIATVRAWIGRFGFAQEKADVLVSGLSGGEKTRLALALMAQLRPNLMILDEPTNHLDVDARKSLIKALNEYSGALILISHDRHLIETTADQLWLVRGGEVNQYHEDLEAYTTLLLSDRSGERRAKRNEDEDDRRVDRKQSRREKADQRKRLAPLKKTLDEAEKNLETAMTEKEQVDSALADPKTYEGPSETVATLSRRQKELDRQVSALEEEWLEASSAYEDAES